MFYFLSKLLAFLIQPSMWIIFALLAALMSRSAFLRKRFILLGLLLFLVFGNGYLFERTMRGMESERSQEDLTQHPPLPYAVLLGGYAEWNHRSQDMELYRSADRLTEALELYKTGQVEKLILSSGVSHEDGSPTEAEMTADYFVANGVDRDDLLIEDRSWNTFQNAYYSAILIDSLELGQEGLLITSAFHMRRADLCFRKQGLSLRPYPTDYYSKGHDFSLLELWPTMATVVAWNVPIKEYVGITVYRLKGYL